MLGDTIKKNRTKLKLTSAAFSKLAGIDKTYMNKIEKNERTNPSFDIVKNICKALDITMDQLDLEIFLDESVLDLFDYIFSKEPAINFGKKKLDLFKDISFLDQEKILIEFFDKFMEDSMIKVESEFHDKSDKRFQVVIISLTLARILKEKRFETPEAKKHLDYEHNFDGKTVNILDEINRMMKSLETRPFDRAFFQIFFLLVDKISFRTPTEYDLFYKI